MARSDTALLFAFIALAATGTVVQGDHHDGFGGIFGGGDHGRGGGNGDRDGGHGDGGDRHGGHWGGSWADPIMTGFDGRTFEFVGEVGSYYNIISEREHQVTMKLKEGVMWDHVGTYMEGVGFKYQDHAVIVELAHNDSMNVWLDGKRLLMAEGENEQEHILALEHGELMILWDLFRPDVGNAVEITSDLLSLNVFLTPAGMRDEGGVVQPAYLNFDALLLSAPANSMKGVIGEGYERLTKGAVLPDDFSFKGREEEYRMDGYFATDHIHNAFGVAAAVYPKRRMLESSSLAFPLSFGRYAEKAFHLHTLPASKASGRVSLKPARKLLSFWKALPQ